MRHRLACVGQKIEEYLLEIALGAGDRREIIGHINHEFDSAATETVLQDRRRGFDRTPHVGVSGSPCRSPGE